MLKTLQGPAERDLLQQVCAEDIKFVKLLASLSTTLDLERRAESGGRARSFS